MSGGQTFGESTEKIVKSFWKIQPERDSKYLAWIKELPCIICKYPHSDPHHSETGGKGTKASDYTCLPLCHIHHQMVHTYGKQTFQKEFNIDFKSVCKRLNAIWKETLP